MGLFGRKKKDKAGQNGNRKEHKPEVSGACSAEGITVDDMFRYLQEEGFFPERDPDGDAGNDLLYFKFQGMNVTVEIPESDYLRLIVVYEVEPDKADYFNLLMAASQVMYELKIVKIVTGQRWVQFSVETFSSSLCELSLFFMRCLNILSDAVERHRKLYAKYVEECQKDIKDKSGSHDEDPFDSMLKEVIDAQSRNPLKS